MGMSFIVTGRDIPANCFRCPLNKGVWKQEQDPFILCRYTKEIVRYDDVPTDRRLPCCGLKEMPEKHGNLIDETPLMKYFLANKYEKFVGGYVAMMLMATPTIVEAEGD